MQSMGNRQSFHHPLLYIRSRSRGCSPGAQTLDPNGAEEESQKKQGRKIRDLRRLTRREAKVQFREAKSAKIVRDPKNMGEESATAGRPITCKAAVVWAPGEQFKIEDVIVAPPRKRQVRVKVLYGAICHTDIVTSKMQPMAPLFPAIFGHEAAGIVESVGEGVTKVKVGDHVLPFCVGQCGECAGCKADVSNVCKNRPLTILTHNLQEDDKPHFTTTDGTVLSRLMALGTFSEYTVVHEDNVVAVNQQAPLDKICLLGCGVSTGIYAAVIAPGIGAAWNVAKVRKGATVAIFGLGTIGLAVSQACKLAGASRIIGLDTNDKKSAWGKELGLTDFINPVKETKGVPELINELIPSGVDYAFECVGIPKCVEDAINSTQPTHGVTVVLGVPGAPSQFSVDIYPFLLGRTVIGSSMGGNRTRQLPQLVDKCFGKNMTFPLDAFATHALPFSKINEAVEIFRSGESLRCVLQYGA